MEKKCSDCGEYKPVTNEYFYTKLGKLINQCKVCRSKKDSLYREQNKNDIALRKKKHRENNIEHYTQKDRRYYANNRDGILKAKSEYYLENKEKKSEYNKEYRLKNTDILKLKDKKYAVDNRARIISYQKQYRLSNKERLNETTRVKRLYKRKTDVSYRLLHNLRSRLNLAMKGKLKSKKTIELIGCSVESLRSHITSRFKIGMTWENYGEWHVDHIRPCSTFNLTDPEQQKQCFNFSNLPPLWANENLIKGANWR